MAKSILDRLKEKYTVNEDGCWVWHAATSNKGKWVYGVILFNRKMCMAHRVSYELLRGEIPEGLDLDHLCRNTRCINPAHLEAVTHKENIRRGYDLKPHKTHCINGHELSIDNIYIKTRNSRDSWECIICRKEQWEKFKAKDTRKVLEPKRCIYVEYEGQKIATHELAKRFGIDRKLFLNRLNAGWSIEDAISKPSRKGKICSI